MTIFTLITLVGTFFGFLGAVMAYLITYNEYIHHYPTKREPKRLALQTGLFTFTFFLIIVLLLAYIFAKTNL